MLLICNTHHFTECNSCVSYTELHRHDSQTLRSSIVTVAVELHTRGACNVGKLCGSSRGEAAAQTAVKTIEEFFYADGVGGHDKQNIL